MADGQPFTAAEIAAILLDVTTRRPGALLMLWRLLKTYLGPYKGALAAVVVLQLLGNIASLVLPSINGDIIDRGVANGDTGYILEHGALMLGVAAFQVVCS